MARKYNNSYSAEEKRIASLKLPIKEVYKIYQAAGFTRSKECLRKWRYDNGILESEIAGGKVRKVKQKPRPRTRQNRFPVGVREWFMDTRTDSFVGL